MYVSKQVRMVDVVTLYCEFGLVTLKSRRAVGSSDLTFILIIINQFCLTNEQMI